jgi:hypothetical protein
LKPPVPDFSKKQMTVEASMYDWRLLVEHLARSPIPYTEEGTRVQSLMQKIEFGLTGNFDVSGDGDA